MSRAIGPQLGRWVHTLSGRGSLTLRLIEFQISTPAQGIVPANCQRTDPSLTEGHCPISDGFYRPMIDNVAFVKI